MVFIFPKPSAKASLALILRRVSAEINPGGAPTAVLDPETKTVETHSLIADKYLTEEAKSPSLIVKNILLLIALIRVNKKSG